MSVADDLSKLAELRDKGVLSQEEFDTQKAKLLAVAPAAEPPLPPKNKSFLARGCLIAAGLFFLLVLLVGILAPDRADTPTSPGAVTDVSRSAKHERDSAADEAPPSVTMANFNRIRNGMTYAEVVSILGQPTQELSRTEVAGIETVMYQWDGGFMANMNAMFQNGKMVSKAQFGLR